MTTLDTAPLAPLLDRLFDEAQAQIPPRERVAALQVDPGEHARLQASVEEADYRALFGLFREAYMAVSRETAALLYMLARSTGAQQIIEFGTSFGVSTLHLAAALRDNGGGRLITTELEPEKAARAQANFVEAGLGNLIELRQGDALQTLGRDLPESVDLVLLDGAKPLYPRVLTLLEPFLRPGALIVADNAERSVEYLQRVRSSTSGYLSTPVADDVELSMWGG